MFLSFDFLEFTSLLTRLYFAASCGSLPYDMTNMETDSVTPDCSGTEVGGRCNINCSHYSFLHGSSYATCEFNSEDHSTDWHIPEGMEEPRCEGSLMFPL